MKAVEPIGGPTQALPNVVKNSDTNVTVSNSAGVNGLQSDAVVIHLHDEPPKNLQKISDELFSEPELEKIRYQNELKLSSVVPSVDRRYVDFMNSISEEKQRLNQFIKVISHTDELKITTNYSKFA